MRQLTDRKNKWHFRVTTPAVHPPAPPPAAMPHPGLLRAAQRVAAAPPERPGARRSTAQRSRRMGEGRAIRGAGGQAREGRFWKAEGAFRSTGLQEKPIILDTILCLVVLLAVIGLTSVAHAAVGYNFTRLVDHVDDNFNLRSFTCASINESGDVAFKGTRSAPDGLSLWDVIARVNRAGVITTIAEDPARTQFQFSSNVVSINDSGQTSFTAFLSNNDIAIFRADGTSMTTIASTAGRFSSFGFDTSLNNAGEVAFTAQLDNGEQGLFSGTGTGGPVTTHYTSARPVLVDGVMTNLAGGNFGRPSINNTGGEIAFRDRVNGPVPVEGIFAGRRGVFRTLGPTDHFYNGAGDRGDANNNDLGIGAFETSFNNNGQFVTAIATSNAGVLSIVADTLNGYAGFSVSVPATAPAINNRGQVAFRGFLPDFTTDGVFTGPNPKQDAIITSKEKLDGAQIISSSFSVCSEALNNLGEVVFIVDLVDPTRIEGFRSAIYLASPKKPLAP